MSFEEGLVTYLKSVTAIKNAVDTRIFGQHLPQTAILPCIVYQRISTSRVLTHDQNSSGLVRATFQFDVYSTTYVNALSVTDALRSALQGYKGAMGSVQVGAVLPRNEVHLEERELDIVRIMSEYEISYQEV